MSTCDQILIVDGDPDKLTSLSRPLRAFGYDVRETLSGEEAIRLVRERRPPLVLLGRVLPDMDGSEVCQHIKTDSELAATFVAFTSELSVSRRQKAADLVAKADTQITWPISNRQLLAQVQIMLRLKRAEDALQESIALRASQAFLQSVLDSLSANIVILDETGTIVAVNASWRRFAEENDMSWPDQGLGRNYLRVLDSAQGRESKGAPEIARAIREVISGTREYITIEYPCHSPSEKRWFTMSTTRFQSEDGVRVVLAHHNVTRQKLAERQLKRAKQKAERSRREEEKRRQEAERRRQIAESLSEVLVALNSNRPVSEVLELIVGQASQLFDSQAVSLYTVIDKGYIQDGTSGESSMFELVAGVDAAVDHAFLDQVLSSQYPIFTPSAIEMAENGFTSGSTEMESSAGEWFRCGCHSTLGVPIIWNNEPMGGLLLYFEDERQFTREDLELAAVFGNQLALVIENAKLREEARESARVSERARLARELHDSVTQSLYSLTLLAEGQRRLAQSGNLSNVAEALNELGEIAQQALKEMRLLVYELRPLALTSEGLLGALQRRLNTVESRAGVEARLEGNITSPLPPKVEEELYWIAQEALNNALKHSGARKVLVRVSPREGQLEMEIIDDGQGFDLPDRIQRIGMGLHSMEERVAKLKGTLTIESKLGEGTQVRVKVPDEQSRRYI